MERGGGGDPMSALASLLAPERPARRPLPLLLRAAAAPRPRLRRAQGHPRRARADEPLTLTEIAQRLHRTPGSTKDYLSWLEDVDLVSVRQKRYSFTDPVLRLWVRLHCRPSRRASDDLAREVHAYAVAGCRCPSRRSPSPTAARRVAADAAPRRAGGSSRSTDQAASVRNPS